MTAFLYKSRSFCAFSIINSVETIRFLIACCKICYILGRMHSSGYSDHVLFTQQGRHGK